MPTGAGVGWSRRLTTTETEEELRLGLSRCDSLNKRVLVHKIKWILQAHLQHCHLLAVTKQAEGKRVLVVESWADLAASEGQRGDVALQVIPVLVEEQLVVLQATPALPPAVIGQHVQVACQPQQMQDIKTPMPSLVSNLINRIQCVFYWSTSNK